MQRRGLSLDRLKAAALVASRARWDTAKTRLFSAGTDTLVEPPITRFDKAMGFSLTKGTCCMSGFSTMLLRVPSWKRCNREMLQALSTDGLQLARQTANLLGRKIQ